MAVQVGLRVPELLALPWPSPGVSPAAAGPFPGSGAPGPPAAGWGALSRAGGRGRAGQGSWGPPVFLLLSSPWFLLARCFWGIWGGSFVYLFILMQGGAWGGSFVYFFILIWGAGLGGVGFAAFPALPHHRLPTGGGGCPSGPFLCAPAFTFVLLTLLFGFCLFSFLPFFFLFNLFSLFASFF